MRKNRYYQDICSTKFKKKLKTRKHAMTAKTIAEKKYDCVYDIYKCPDCKDYHLTTSKKV